MESSEIGVLIVDDSALMRNLISKIIDNTPGLTVAGKAMNGQFALEKLATCSPDVIVLDIEMPVMNGLEFLRERKKRGIDIPVIMLSSLTTEGAAVTMQCLELGASDFLTKPGGSSSGDLSAVAARLAELLPSYGGQYARIKKHKNIPVHREPEYTAVHSGSGVVKLVPENHARQPYENIFTTPRQPKKPVVITPVRESGKIEVIAIGISTGGPNALREVFKDIDPELKQPVLVVQHMPAGFTEEFANSLDHICPLEVKEAHDGDLLKSGRILIAPGNYHIYVEQRSLAYVVRLSDAPPRNGHRPSADVLFESIAAVFQNRALGVIMTGMGNDGTIGMTRLYNDNNLTIAQDKLSCTVYGMPRSVIENKVVHVVLSLYDIAEFLVQYLRGKLK